MGQYFLITGTGKTGTTWLAKGLDHPKAGIVCLDEGKFPQPNGMRDQLRKITWLQRLWTWYRRRYGWLGTVDNRLLGWNTWLDFAEYELQHGLGPRFDAYFKSIKAKLDLYVAVGDSHSWDPHMIPEVHERIRVSQIIHLVRNGIPNVHALAVHNRELFETSPVIRHQLDRYIEMFGGECTNAWEYWCFWWSVNSLIPGWLRSNLPDVPVDVFRLEDLVIDNGQLEKIIENLNPGSLGKISNLRRLRENNDNRDQTGDRSPSDIWESWTDEQKESFQRICGDAMEHYGYEIP